MKTPLPDAAVLGEFAIVAARNARRLLTDAETLLTRGGWPTASSLALLAFEEAGKSWLCVNVLAMPGELKAEFSFGELVGGYGSHLFKLQAARMIAPWLAFLKAGRDAVSGFLDAIERMEGLAREDNEAKKRGLYADCQEGVIWDPSQVTRDEARDMVARVRDVLDRSAPLADPDFIRFMAGPSADAKPELDALTGRLMEYAQQDDPEGAFGYLADLYAETPGFAESFEGRPAHGPGLCQAGSRAAREAAEGAAPGQVRAARPVTRTRA